MDGIYALVVCKNGLTRRELEQMEKDRQLAIQARKQLIEAILDKHVPSLNN